MTDQVFALPGDDLDREHLAEYLGRTGISDYVERGLDIHNADVDYANAVVDIPGGKAFLIDNGRDSMLFADPRAGLKLATDGVNHVFIYYDLNQPDGEKIGFHVSQDGTSPSFPHLLIAEIDMGAQSVDRKNQTAPVYRRNAITYKSNDIDEDGDGVVDASETTNHIAGSDVEGAVAEANHADTATTAANLDASDGIVEVGATVDLNLNTLDRPGLIKHRGRDAPNIGLDILTETVNGENKSRLIPTHPNSGRIPSAAFGYNFFDGWWELGGGLKLSGGHLFLNSNPINGVGGITVTRQTGAHSIEIVVENDGGTNFARVIPVDENGAKRGDSLQYRFGTGEWTFKSGVHVAEEFSVPSRSSRPSGASQGTIIYRSDKA